jgi:ribose transport system substrate-binding protein
MSKSACYGFSKTMSLVIVAAFTLVACGSNAGSETDSKFTVGISNPQGAQPILKMTQDTFTAAAERDGIAVKALDAQLDPAKQVTDVDQLIAQQVDLIVVYPLDANSLKPALQRADAAGIKVIGWAALASPDSDPGVLTSNVDTGGSYRGSALLAEFVKDKLGGRGNVLGVGLGIPVPILETMMSQYEKNVMDGSEIKWLGRVDNPTDDIAGGQKVVATALTKYQNNVQAIMAYNDAAAIGAAVAARTAGLNNVVIVGQNGDDDGIEAVEDGRLSATIDLVPWRTGLILETITHAILNGQQVPSFVESPTELYTAGNSGTRLPWADAASQIESGAITCGKGGGCPESVAALVN